MSVETGKVMGLVMAASRSGPQDSVAQLQGKSNKNLVEIAGKVMLERVVGTLLESDCFRHVMVSIEDAALVRSAPQLAAWLDEGRISIVQSRGNLADSVLDAVAAADDPLPLVITTGDNALHTPELVRDFVTGFLAATEDAVVAFTAEDIVLQSFPNAGLAFHKLKDGGWSACNLYGLRNKKALEAVQIFQGGGQFGKRHWRILKAFGVMPFILYKLKWTTLDGLLARIAKNLGLSASAVRLPYAFGPIDVDNPKFFQISEKELMRRQ